MQEYRYSLLRHVQMRQQPKLQQRNMCRQLYLYDHRGRLQCRMQECRFKFLCPGNCSDNCGGYRSCCKTAAEYCIENGYKLGIVCEKGQTTETCPADSNYKKCSGDGCPASQTCTYGCKTYSSQSGCSDVCTVCYDDNCHNRTAVSVPANASCSAYYDDCPSKCSAWACKSGYNKSGNSCVCATTCTNSVTSKPANSTYVTSSCTACGVTTTINTDWKCNSGYNKSGNSCVCATTCKDTATVPANATAVKSNCTACGQTYSIVTGFTCNSGYTKSGNSCVKQCQVGDILYSDASCSSSKVSGKTPVGVVAYIAGSTRFAVALEESSSTLYWSTPSYENLSCLTDYRSVAEAQADFRGATNTSCIINYRSSNSYPAAEYCNNYKPVSSGTGSSGWYLPAAGELYVMNFSYGAINLGLQKLSKTQLPNAYYWSSSESYLTSNAWVVRPSDGGMNYFTKYANSSRGRCVLAF